MDPRVLVLGKNSEHVKYFTRILHQHLPKLRIDGRTFKASLPRRFKVCFFLARSLSAQGAADQLCELFTRSTWLSGVHLVLVLDRSQREADYRQLIENFVRDGYLEGIGYTQGEYWPQSLRAISILRLIADEGLNYRQIAARLDFSIETVKGDMKRMSQLLGCSNNREVIMTEALRRGWLI